MNKIELIKKREGLSLKPYHCMVWHIMNKTNNFNPISELKIDRTERQILSVMEPPTIDEIYRL